MLYKKNNKIAQFGWKTQTGFCFGLYKEYSIIPLEIKKFTVIPFAKMTIYGDIEKNFEEPVSVAHSKYYIFILYKDCLTIISKISSYIIYSKFFETELKGIIYNEFSSYSGGNILLFSKTSLYEIILTNANNDIWREYLILGSFSKAIRKCKKNERLIRAINRIYAEEAFKEKDYFKSSEKYANSDERFEIVCLKFIMNDKMDCLDIYLKSYLANNIPDKIINKNDQKFIIQSNLISTLLVEVFVNKNNSDKILALEEFGALIKRNFEYLKDGNIILQLLQKHGKMEEFVEFASIMGDYENIILYYINNLNISGAIEKLTFYVDFSNDESIKILSQIFLNYCQIFFINNPEESISLVQQSFKNIEMKAIVQAIISSDDEREIISYDIKNCPTSLNISRKENNYKVFLNYLKSLVEKSNKDEENNIHNLYLYYLSKNKSNQENIIKYLQRYLIPLDSKDPTTKKEVLFQINYAKKVFKNNPPAYSLILVLEGNYLEGVKSSLKTITEESLKLAEFIAENAPDDKLKKILWVEIFNNVSQKNFKKALNILTETKILKIEDVLPHTTDSIKIEDFKNKISECINDYQNNINKFKEDILEYNTNIDNMKNEIENLKKNQKDIQYSNYRCNICQGYIIDKDIYLFPCGHMFDANCIRECLLEYEATGLDSIHNDNIKIDKYFKDLDLIKESAFIEKNNEEKKIVEKEQQKQGKNDKFINIIFEKGNIKQEDIPVNDNKENIYLIKTKEKLIFFSFKFIN